MSPFRRQIYEVSAADGSDLSGGPITTSHFDGQLTGLATHPQRAEYATAGGDGTVGVRYCSVAVSILLSTVAFYHCSISPSKAMPARPLC